MLIGTLALVALLALPAFAQAAGTITVKKGGYRDSATNNAGTYALGLSGAAFEYAAYSSATDPRTLSDAAINALTWLPLCSPTSAAGTCTSGSLANGRYLVREKTAPAGWSVVQSAAWSGGSSGASPVRQYIADVTVNNNTPTAEPVPAGLGGSVGGTSSPASSIFVNRRDNRAFPSTCGLKVLLLLDKSGSIGDTTGEATAYAGAAKGFVDALAGTPTSLKIASFNTSAGFVGPGTGTEYNLGAAGDRTTAKGQIDSIYAGVSGGTNWDAGMRLAATAGVDVVIFITDGNPTAYGDASGFSGQSSRVDLLDLTYGIAASNLAKTGGSTGAAASLTQKVLAVGVGSGITEDNLKAVSGPNKFVSAGDTNPDYAAVTDVTQLGAALKAIANRLCGSRIHVRKLTDGDANPSQARAGWTFTAGGGGSPVAFTPGSVVTDGTVAHDVIAVDQIPAAGSASAVTVTETAQPGYSLAASQCVKGADSSAFPTPANGVGTTTQSIAQVKQNEDWWCTFRNARDATVQIVKDAVPDGAQDFAFTTTGLGSGFSLDDDADATLPSSRTITVSGAGLGFGSKSITETATTGWSLTSLSCTRNGNAAGAPSGATATLDVQPGDAWVCTFTNRRDATIQITKDAQPNAAQDFAFTTTGSGLNGFSLDDDADGTLPNTTTLTVPAANFGTKTVSETPVGNWDLASLTCTNAAGAPAAAIAYGTVTNGVFAGGANGAAFGVGDTAVQVDAQAGTQVACTFTNRQIGLDVTKSAVQETVNAGEPIGYRITTRNTGPGTARSVVTTDPLPAGVSWTVKSQTTAGECAIAPAGATSGQVLTCTYGDLPGGAQREVEVEAATTATACVTYDNTATATAANAPSDSATAVIRCVRPSVSITKEAAASPIDAGEAATFTITVANGGPGLAAAVKVSDPLPPGLTWTEDSADCAIADDPANGDVPTLSCDFGDLADGASRAVTLTARTSYAACATYANTATVSGSNFASRQASDTIVCRTADLHVVKTPEDQLVDAGDPIGFEMVTTNSGTGTATGVTLRDPLPAGVTWAIAAQDDDSDPLDCAITGAANSQVLDCAYGDLAADATRTVRVTAATSYDDCAVYVNTAAVAASNAPGDHDSGRITCRRPALDVTKIAVETIVSAGDRLGFTITTQNTGEGRAKDVTLSDPLPAGVTWSIVAQDDETDPLECAIAGAAGEQVLTCNYGDLPAGALRTVRIEAQTTDDACTTYDNTATATAGNAPGDSDRAVIDCRKPNVTITKTAAVSPINAGEDAAFTITVKNQGSSQTTGAAVAVTLRDPLTPSLTWTLDGPDAPSCAIADSQLACDFGDLAPGATRTVTLTAPTTRDECGTYENTATVDGANFAAKTASDTVVCRKPRLTVDKVAAHATVDPGDPVSFTVTSANAAGEDVGVAKDVTLRDPLPAGLTWTLTGQDEACTISGEPGSQVLDCSYGDLNPGASRSVTVTGTTSFAQCGVYDNTATLSAANAADVEDAASTTCRPPATVRIRKLVSGQGADATKFGFQTTLTPNAENRPANFQLSQDDGTTAFTVRADGTTYSIRELEPYGAGYRFVSAGCVQDQLQAESRASRNTTTDEQRTTTVTPVSGASYTCTFTNTKLASSLLVVKGPKTQAVYRDGSANYTYDVSNPGTSDLADVALTDDKCTAISAPDKSTGVDPDNDGDELLETGETWRYTCTVSAADLFRTSTDPVTNTATATAKDQAGTTLTARDTALTTLLAPGIAIDKTGPATAIAGELITYNLAVTNTGNTSFPEGGVKLTDTLLTGGACQKAPTVPVSKNGDKTAGELNPGETWIYQCQVQTKAGATKVTNKGDVAGTDTGGKTVTATDTAETLLAAPGGGVSPAGKVSGRARLSGTVGCATARYAKASVTGSSIRQVTFYVNGKKVKTLTKPNSGKNYQVVFRTKTLKYGTYKVRAGVRFRANAVPQSRTLNVQFNRCRPRVIKPKFTG